LGKYVRRNALGNEFKTNTFNAKTQRTAKRDMKVSLFITCLVDQFFPEVGMSVVRLLRKLGVEVDFPEDQTCCGQPAFNSGFTTEARELAKRFIAIFENSEYVVAPSGSCT
jgi:L-lactate dehydrogenase complex protein LldE